jgi:hypothetical protein
MGEQGYAQMESAGEQSPICAGVGIFLLILVHRRFEFSIE